MTINIFLVDEYMRYNMMDVGVPNIGYLDNHFLYMYGPYLNITYLLPV